MKQLSLFNEPAAAPLAARRAPRGGSQNPIVFRDYASFVAKFHAEAAKTTDDCYTPPDVYEAVVRYVGTLTDLNGRDILRPFYPGGDYINAEYPEGGIVIDNPPFSQFSKIVRFYHANGIPFFLFGNGMTIMQCCKWATAVITGSVVKFDNGASIRINFATSLIPDCVAVTAPTLAADIAACKSQEAPAKKLPKYEYPAELVSTSMMQTIADNGIALEIRRGEAEVINDLDNHPAGLFGSHLLVARQAAERARQAAERARTIHVTLSEREEKIVERLSNRYEDLT